MVAAIPLAPVGSSADIVDFGNALEFGGPAGSDDPRRYCGPLGCGDPMGCSEPRGCRTEAQEAGEVRGFQGRNACTF